jgi:hypothetical protein
LFSVIRRGHNHAVYSLKDNSPYTNPAMIWEKSKKKAMNSLSKLDRDGRERVSDIIRTFLMLDDEKFRELRKGNNEYADFIYGF